MGWLLVLGLKEGLVECATVCFKSKVILVVYIVSWSWKEKIRHNDQTMLTVDTCAMSGMPYRLSTLRW